MNKEIARIKTDLERVNTKNPHLQMSLINTLLQQVTDFVTDIVESKKMVKELSNIKNSLNDVSHDPEQVAEKKELEHALELAREAENHIDLKKRNLRELQREIETLRVAINRAIAA